MVEEVKPRGMALWFVTCGMTDRTNELGQAGECTGPNARIKSEEGRCCCWVNSVLASKRQAVVVTLSKSKLDA